VNSGFGFVKRETQTFLKNQIRNPKSEIQNQNALLALSFEDKARKPKGGKEIGK
jgi:hypothetical protein